MIICLKCVSVDKSVYSNVLPQYPKLSGLIVPLCKIFESSTILNKFQEIYTFHVAFWGNLCLLEGKRDENWFVGIVDR